MASCRECSCERICFFRGFVRRHRQGSPNMRRLEFIWSCTHGQSGLCGTALETKSNRNSDRGSVNFRSWGFAHNFIQQRTMGRDAGPCLFIQQSILRHYSHQYARSRTLSSGLSVVKATYQCLAKLELSSLAHTWNLLAADNPLAYSEILLSNVAL